MTLVQEPFLLFKLTTLVQTIGPIKMRTQYELKENKAIRIVQVKSLPSELSQENPSPIFFFFKLAKVIFFSKLNLGSFLHL